MSRRCRFGFLTLLLALGFLLPSSVSRAEDGKRIAALVPVQERPGGPTVSLGPEVDLPVPIASVPTAPETLHAIGQGGRPARDEVSLASRPEETGASGRLLSHRITATIPLTPGVGLEPVDIAADPNSPLVYIANQGSQDITVVSGTEILGMVVGVREASFGSYPPRYWLSSYSMRLEMDSTAGLLYAVEGMSDRCFSLAQNYRMQVIQNTEVITSVDFFGCMGDAGGGCAVNDLVFQPTNGYLYVAEYYGPFPSHPAEGFIEILERGTEITKVVIPGVDPRFIAADEQRGWVYVSALYTDSLFVLSDTVLFGKVPVSEAGAIEVQPTTGLAYVQSGGEYLVVLSGTERLGEIRVGEVAGMKAHPGNGLLYLSHPVTPSVTIVSGTAVLTEVAVISSGGRLEVEPAGGLVYLRHPEAGWITVLSGTKVLTEVEVLGGDAAIGANGVSGLVYAVDGSNSVAVLREGRVEGHLPKAFPRPKAMEVDARNGRVVLLGSGGYSALGWIEGEELRSTLVLTFTPGQMVVHPQRGWIYLTSPEEGKVRILSGTVEVDTVPLSGEVKDMAVQPRNGLVYIPTSAGILYVLDGSKWITVSLSSRALRHVAVDEERGWVYVVEPEKYWLYIVSGTEVVSNVHFSDYGYPGQQGLVAVEPRSGYVYVGDNQDHSVWLWVIHNASVITQIQWNGSRLLDMEVSPVTGYLYVQLGDGFFSCETIEVVRGEEKVSSWWSWPPGRHFSVLRAHPRSGYLYAGQAVYGSLLSIGVGPTLVTTMTVGDGSWVEAIAVDGPTGRVYVATDHAIAVLEEAWPYRFYLPLLFKGLSW